ncbi:MAG: hypothetical protein IBX49_09460 [Gammaproteobacteria bacterium]|nr:hypothetical protein [Gammaproteobacteria bacterium]
MTNPNLGGKPNILFVIDNSANWSSIAQVSQARFYLVREALLQLLAEDGLDADAYNIGIMMLYNDSAQLGGGFPLRAIQPFTEEVKSALHTEVSQWGLSSDSSTNNMTSNNAAFSGAMHELFLYFRGLRPRVGHLGATNSLTTLYRDLDAYSHPNMTNQNLTYLRPITDICADNYIIFIANGPPAQADTNAMGASSTAVQQLVTDYGMDNSIIPLNPDYNSYQNNMMDEYARFLKDQGIYTFTIDVYPGSGGQWPDHIENMRSTAKHGGGEYYDANNVEELKEAIYSALNQIQAIDSVFAASSLPVSVNTRGTHLNEVYMAMFRPDELGRPRWTGNLKLFEFMLDTGNNLVMADAQGNPAQNTLTGFLRSDAVSFWTYEDGSNYWEFDERGTPPSATDSPDGEVVEKGGAAQQIRMKDFPAGRNMFTCAGSCSTGQPLHTFAASNDAISADMLGVDASKREQLIDWIRGEDNYSYTNTDGDTVSSPERIAGEARPSLHGDVVHSSPLVINYNRTGDDNDLVVFYGANDGQLRAVRGGKPCNVSFDPACVPDTDLGRELWSFIPQPFLNQFVRLYENTPTINTPSIPYPGALINGEASAEADFARNKPYLFDGSLTSYVLGSNGNIDHTEGDRALIFATMRRGGRFLVAMDVSNPDEPRFMWQKGCIAGACDTGYENLGQTWSEPVVRRVRLSDVDGGSEDRLVLIMGAGYDAQQEDRYPQGTITQGQGILIIDAEDGEVLWRARPSSVTGIPTDIPQAEVVGMDYSIPAPVVTITRDGVVSRVYVPDTGGNIWRVDLVTSTNAIAINPSDWKVSKLAELGGAVADVRKFLHRVDIAEESDAYGRFIAVVIGSGDREKPFEEDVVNRFYMVKDRDLIGQRVSDTITEADLLDITNNMEPDSNALSNKEGWFLSLLGGEKTVGRAEARGGFVFFGTNQPASMVISDSCVSDLGVARAYAINLSDGSPIGESTHRNRDLGPNVGLPPPYIHVIVPVRNPNYDPTDPDSPEFIIVEGVTSGADTQQLATGGLNTRTRLFWNKDVE